MVHPESGPQFGGQAEGLTWNMHGVHLCAPRLIENKLDLLTDLDILFKVAPFSSNRGRGGAVPRKPRFRTRLFPDRHQGIRFRCTPRTIKSIQRTNGHVLTRTSSKHRFLVCCAESGHTQISKDTCLTNCAKITVPMLINEIDLVCH